MKRALVVIEMLGTVNALRKPLDVLKAKHGWEVKYVASGQALSRLMKDDARPWTSEQPVDAVFDNFKPDIVITGVTAVKPDHLTWTGLEQNYAMAAMDWTKPVVMYRDYLGISEWAGDVTLHPRSKHLLHFLMFDEATVSAIRKKNWFCCSLKAVGSAYYDDLAEYKKAERRHEARKALGLEYADILLLLNSGAVKERVLEILGPVVDGLLEIIGDWHIVFAPTFHPRDPDAPYIESSNGRYIPRISVYDSELSRLQGKAKCISEPVIRNILQDPRDRIAAADFIIINAASTDTWTAAFLGVPMVLPLLPKEIENLEADLIDSKRLDLVLSGAADAIYSRHALKLYIKNLCLDFKPVANAIKKNQIQWKPGQSTDKIVEAILNIVR